MELRNKHKKTKRLGGSFEQMSYAEVTSYERSQPNHVDENSHIEDMDEDMLLDSDQKPYKRASV